jgi:hypothetical protein
MIAIAQELAGGSRLAISPRSFTASRGDRFVLASGNPDTRLSLARAAHHPRGRVPP